MELMKMRSFPTNVSLTILTENSHLREWMEHRGIAVLVVCLSRYLTTSWRMKNRKWAEIQRSQIQSTSLAKVNGTVVTGEGITNSALLYHSD